MLHLAALLQALQNSHSGPDENLPYWQVSPFMNWRLLTKTTLVHINMMYKVARWCQLLYNNIDQHRSTRLINTKRLNMKALTS